MTSSSEIFSGIGALLSAATVSLLYTFMPKDIMQTYGWRVAYIIGFLLAIITIYLQSFCSESEVFLQESKNNKSKHNPLKRYS